MAARYCPDAEMTPPEKVVFYNELRATVIVIGAATLASLILPKRFRSLRL
jgi:hypothetical protein